MLVIVITSYTYVRQDGRRGSKNGRKKPRCDWKIQTGPCLFGEYSSAHLSVRRYPHQFFELGLSPLYATSLCGSVQHETKQVTYNTNYFDIVMIVGKFLANWQILF